MTSRSRPGSDAPLAPRAATRTAAPWQGSIVLGFAAAAPTKPTALRTPNPYVGAGRYVSLNTQKILF